LNRSYLEIDTMANVERNVGSSSSQQAAVDTEGPGVVVAAPPPKAALVFADLDGTLTEGDMHTVLWIFVRSLPSTWQRWLKTLLYPPAVAAAGIIKCVRFKVGERERERGTES
jgi:hypothetical protein